MKKRILSAVFAVIICLTAAMPAFADNGGYFTPYNITVTSETGVVLYDHVWNADMTRSIMRPMTIFVPSGTQLTVTGEREFEGEVYLAVEYSDFNAYVPLSKVSLQKEIAGTEVAYATAAERSVVIINKDGVYLRKGPSLAYEISSELIPYGTVITYSKVNSQFELDAQWAYTEYNGISGWLYIYQYGTESIYDCAYILSEADGYTGTLEVLTDGAHLTETADPQSVKVAENIPAGTTFTYKYFYENYDSISAFVEYNGVKGWLRTRDSAYKVATGERGGIYVLAGNGLPLYEKPLDESAQVIATLPKNTNLSVDKQYWDAEEVDGKLTETRWMHVNYNGTQGWVYSDDITEYCYMFSAYDLKIAAADSLNLYSEPDEESKVISVVPKDTVVTCVYETKAQKGDIVAYWSFVEYNGAQGWIFSTEEEAVYVEGSEKQLDAGAHTVPLEITGDAPELTAVNHSPNDGKNGISSKTVIIICASAAAIAAAAVVIVVIKKKKSE